MGARCRCKRVKRIEWHEQLISLDDRSFYTNKIPLLMHIPFKLPQKFEKLSEEIELKEYKRVDEGMVLMKDGAFSGLVMMEIEKIRFFDPRIFTFGPSHLFAYVTEEPWDQLVNVMQVAKKKCEARGSKAKEVYFWYTSCGKCVEFEGYQTVILIQT